MGICRDREIEKQGNESLEIAPSNRVVIYGSTLGREFEILIPPFDRFLEERGIGDVRIDICSNDRRITGTFYGLDSAFPEIPRTIPRGVISFPEIYRRDMIDRTIVDLCAKHRVPYVRFSANLPLERQLASFVTPSIDQPK